MRKVHGLDEGSEGKPLNTCACVYVHGDMQVQCREQGGCLGDVRDSERFSSTIIWVVLISSPIEMGLSPCLSLLV